MSDSSGGSALHGTRRVNTDSSPIPVSFVGPDTDNCAESFVDRQFHQQEQRPVSVSIATGSNTDSASGVAGVPTKISPSEDVANDDSFNARTLDVLNNLNEFIASSHIASLPDTTGPFNPSDYVEEAIDVLSEGSGLLVMDSPNSTPIPVASSTTLKDSNSTVSHPKPSKPLNLHRPHSSEPTDRRRKKSVTITEENTNEAEAVPSTSASSDLAVGGARNSSYHASPPSTSAAPSGGNVNPDARTNPVNNEQLEVPIVGYEIMNQQAKFTVFKIQIKLDGQPPWYIFRRYSDFVRLNEQLRKHFSYFRLNLPPKCYFGNNFATNFLENRQKGLQAFLNNIIGHRQVFESECVRAFMCLDDPPGPYDSLEESMAQCDLLEDQVYNLRREVQERDAQITILSEELHLRNVEVDNLKHSLRIERSMQSRLTPSSQQSECSLPEHEQPDSEAATAKVDKTIDVTWDAPLPSHTLNLKTPHLQRHSTPKKTPENGIDEQPSKNMMGPDSVTANHLECMDSVATNNIEDIKSVATNHVKDINDMIVNHQQTKKSTEHKLYDMSLNPTIDEMSNAEQSKLSTDNDLSPCRLNLEMTADSDVQADLTNLDLIKDVKRSDLNRQENAVQEEVPAT